MTLTVVYDDVIFNEQRHGGISRYFSQLLDARRYAGPFLPRTTCRITRNEHLAQSDGFNGWALPDWLPVFQKAKRLGRINRRLTRRSKLWQQADVYHQTFYTPQYKEQRGRLPMVVTVHDMIPERYPLHSARQRRRHEHKRSITEQADAVICVSQTTARFMAELYNVRADRIHICHHGIDPQGFADAPPMDRPIAPPYVLYVGHRGGYKSFDTLLAATGLLREVPHALHVLCVGGGPMEPQHLREMNELGVADRIHRIDVDQAGLVNAYRHAQAMVYPALEEGFGLPILESWACDCPCILADQPTFREVAGDAATFFAAADAQALAQVLREVADNTWPADAVRRRGQARLADYSMPRLIESTAGVYQSLV